MPRPRPNGNANILYKPAEKHRNVAEYCTNKNTAPNRKVRGGIFISCST